MSPNAKKETFRPVLVFELKKKYELFLRYLFGVNSAGSIDLNAQNPVGKMITSMWITSEKPPCLEFKNPVSVSLPITASMHYISKYNHIYVPRWKQEQLRLFIESYYDLTIREFFVIGYERHYTRDTIIDAILRDLNRDEYFFTYDMISKYDYRNRVKISENVRLDLKKNRKYLINN